MKKNLVLAGLLSLIGVALSTSEGMAFFCRPWCHRCCTRITCRPYNAFTPICWGNLVCDGCCPSPCGVAGGCLPMPYMSCMNPWGWAGGGYGGMSCGSMGCGSMGCGPGGCPVSDSVPDSSNPVPAPPKAEPSGPSFSPPNPSPSTTYAPSYYYPAPAYGMNPYTTTPYGWNPYGLTNANYYPGYYPGYGAYPASYTPTWNYGAVPAYWYGAGNGQ